MKKIYIKKKRKKIIKMEAIRIGKKKIIEHFYSFMTPLLMKLYLSNYSRQMVDIIKK